MPSDNDSDMSGPSEAGSYLLPPVAEAEPLTADIQKDLGIMMSTAFQELEFAEVSLDQRRLAFYLARVLKPELRALRGRDIIRSELADLRDPREVLERISFLEHAYPFLRRDFAKPLLTPRELEYEPTVALPREREQSQQGDSSTQVAAPQPAAPNRTRPTPLADAILTRDMPPTARNRIPSVTANLHIDARVISPIPSLSAVEMGDVAEFAAAFDDQERAVARAVKLDAENASPQAAEAADVNVVLGHIEEQDARCGPGDIEIDRDTGMAFAR